jgi:hypothetical protein
VHQHGPAATKAEHYCDTWEEIWLTSGSATEILRSFSIGSGLDLVSHKAARDKSCLRRAQSLPDSSPNAARNQPILFLNPARYLPKLSPEQPRSCPTSGQYLANIYPAPAQYLSSSCLDPA